MDQTEFRARWGYAKELNIQFLGPAPRRQWPDAHRRLFEDIQELGNQKYLSFSGTISVDSIEKPWRRQTTQRATRLAQRSRMSREDRKNEAGWRFSIEPEVLYRFTVEVTCHRCRSRLWKSEIEAAVQSSQPFAHSLEARRKRREPCRCVDQWGYSSGYEDGVNMLFSDRAQAAIKHDPPLPIESRRRGQGSEEPDRVYGVRDTGSLRRLLNSTNKHSANAGDIKSLRDTLEMSPFDDEGERLLFPFLIMEAKSGKHGDMAAVEMQTAFCIRRLLKLQHDLRHAGGDDCGKFEPLVWFLSWSGERWNVAGCFVNNARSSVEWVIVNLWSGDVTGEDGSLQLLLIIDYIFDWARDVYRQSLLAELRSLSMEDISGTDPDIFSTIERGSTVLTRRSNDPLDFPFAPQNTILETLVSSGDFLNLTHAEGAVRDASMVESRFMGLYIREHDVEPFRLSFASDETYRETITKMSSLLEDSWFMSADTLDLIEESWTGPSRPAVSGHTPDGSLVYFFVKLTFRMFVASDWQPVRQLVCLAVTDSAVTQLWGNEMISHFHKGCVYTGREIKKHLNFLKSPSIIDGLTGAISMQCLSNTSRKRTGTIAPSSFGLECDNSTSVLELVSSVFESHTIGRRLSPDSYLHSSHTQSKQSQHTEGPKVWPHLEQLALHPNGTVLVDSVQQSPGTPRRCLYVVDGSYEAADAAHLVEQMSSEGRYYSTLPLGPNHHLADYVAHINRPIGRSKYWKTERNLESFDAWIEALQGLKSTGSMRHGSSSFPILLSDESSSENDEENSTKITVAWREEE